jgi:hypothetical protein
MLVAWDVRCRFRGLSWRTAESTGGGGMKVLRGKDRPRLAWNRRSSRGPWSAKFPWRKSLLLRSGCGDR